MDGMGACVSRRNSSTERRNVRVLQIGCIVERTNSGRVDEPCVIARARSRRLPIRFRAKAWWRLVRKRGRALARGDWQFHWYPSVMDEGQWRISSGTS